jgi:hypothetical protein
VYSKFRHGRNWLGVDINLGLSAQQSASRDAKTAMRPTAARWVTEYQGVFYEYPIIFPSDLELS